jgi:LPS sulfotransferase NodH
MAPRRCCVIATTPRTGSWLLAEALNETGLAGEPQEYFGWEGLDGWSREFGLDPGASFLTFIEKAIAYGTSENGIFCAKVHWSQLQHFVRKVREEPGVWPNTTAELLHHFFADLHCVHLSRADTARQAISYWQAVQAGNWWDDGDTPRRAGAAAELDFQQIRWCEDLLVGQDRSWGALLADADIPTLEVVYEQLVADRAGTVERVLDFLGAERGPIELPLTRLRRQADERTERWLEVYLAIRDELTELPANWRWTGRGIEPVSEETGRR